MQAKSLTRPDGLTRRGLARIPKSYSGGWGSLPPLQDGTKTEYSSWERRQSVRIRSDPAPRTLFHKTVVLCRLSIKAITSQGAVAERSARILLSRLGGEAVTPIPRAGSRAPHAASGKNRIQPGDGTKTEYSSWERRQSAGIRSDPAPRTIFRKTVCVLTCLQQVGRLCVQAITSPRAGRRSYIEAEGNDIPVLDFVCLTLQTDQSGLLGPIEAAVSLQVLITHHLGPNEALPDVRVY